MKSINPKLLHFFFFLCFVLFLKSMAGNMYWPNGRANLHVLQAEAFLKGQLNITQKAHDAAIYKDEVFVVHPPLPAVLLMPLVAVVGAEKTKTVAVSFILAIGLFFCIRDVFKKFNIEAVNASFYSLAFLMGTGFWFVSRDSWAVYGFAHVWAFFFLSLAVREFFYRRRFFLIGSYLGAAFLCRQLCIYAIIPFAVTALQHYKVKAQYIYALVIPFFCSITGYLTLNYLRFENPFDTGYGYIPGIGFGAERAAQYGGFSWRYLIVNSYYYFIQGFDIEFTGKDAMSKAIMNPFGTSLTVASPFLFLALWARKVKQSKIYLAPWFLAVFLILGHSLFYVNNGAAQINTQRFSLDFIPLLLPLFAIGASQANAKVVRGLIFYSIFLNVIALIVIGQ